MSIISRVERFHELIKSYSKEQINRIGTYELDPTIIQNHLIRGKWNCLHFNATPKLSGTELIRIVPWKKSDEWYVGSSTPYYETTNDYPTMLTYLQEHSMRMVIEKKSWFDSYRNNWSEVLDAKLPIYQLFGGSDNLKKLYDYVHDDSLWDAPNIDDQELFFRRKKLSLLLDNSHSNNYLWRFIENMQKGSFLPETPQIELDMHEERVLSAISARAYLSFTDYDFERLEELYMQAVLFAHGFGAEGDDLWVNPRACETAGEVFNPIDFLLDEDEENSEKIKNMPEYHIALAIKEQNESYNGVAHFEVAAQMDDLYNEPRKAWKYLESAGYWAGKNLAASQAIILEAAIHLCNRHGWEEAEEVLHFNKRIMNG